MAEIPKIVLPHGGYKKLIVYRKSDVVYEGTVLFCRRFLPARGEAAGSAKELERTAAELRQKIDRTVWSLRRKKGWS